MVPLPGINTLPELKPKNSPMKPQELSSKYCTTPKANHFTTEQPSTNESLQGSSVLVPESSRTNEIRALNCSQIQSLLLFHGFATSPCPARLGNQLGVLALGLAINMQFGAKLVLHHKQAFTLSHSFDMEKVCKKDGSSFCVALHRGCKPPKMTNETSISVESREDFWERGLSVIGDVPEDVQGKEINLPTYPTFLRWIASYYFAEFRSRVAFKKDIWDDAKMVFNHLNKMHNCSCRKECTSVFVHMRMGDYTKHVREMEWGVDVFKSSNYLQEAFKNVTNAYKNPVFYVLGWRDRDVAKFFRQHKSDFKAMKVVIVAPIEFKLFGNGTKDLIGIDFALMAMSDVLVVSYGSYGALGALFGKDKQVVLYPKGHKANDETGINLGMPRFVPIPWTEQNTTY